MNGQEYKSERKRIGTQSEVAAKLGIHRVTVAKRESGALKITNESALALLSLQKKP